MTVGRTISGPTSIPFAVPNKILGQQLNLSIEVTLEPNGWIVLAGASLFLSETAFGLETVFKTDETSETPLEAELTMNALGPHST